MLYLNEREYDLKVAAEKKISSEKLLFGLFFT